MASTMSKSLTAAEVVAILAEAGVDTSRLTITDDPAVWTNVDTGESGTSVRISGPKDARRAATNVLFDDPHRLGQAPYPDEDYWSR